MAALPAIGSTLGFGGSIGASLTATGTCAGLVSKLAGGPALDRLGGRKALLITLSLISLATAGLSSVRTLPQLCVAYSSCLFAAAPMWPALCLVIIDNGQQGDYEPTIRLLSLGVSQRHYALPPILLTAPFPPLSPPHLAPTIPPVHHHPYPPNPPDPIPSHPITEPHCKHQWPPYPWRRAREFRLVAHRAGSQLITLTPYHSLLATRYSITAHYLATHYSLLTTHASRTHHSPPTTRYSLTRYYSLLTAHHSLHLPLTAH